MHSVSLTFELLRSRPVAVFWFATLAQTVLWTLVPAVFYSAPPGQVAEWLAVGHEFQLGSYLGPPLSYWLAEIAYRVAGMSGVYLLSQACVVITYWAVFSLGRSIVGDRHAAMAVLLMAGVAVFTVPTPEFGPAVMAMALWALMLLHYWRAVGQGWRMYWLPLGVEAGLLLLTTYAGLVLIGLLLAFTFATRRGRAQFSSVEPLIAGVVLVLVLFPHLIWLEQAGSLSVASAAEIADGMRTWSRMLGTLAIGHIGLGILVMLSRGLTLRPRGPAAEIERAPVDPDARWFVYFFALAPAVAIGLIALFSGRAEHFVAAPLAVLTTLAVVVAAPDRIRLVHQRLMQYAWAGLLVFPPLLAAVAVTILPWAFATDLKVATPAAEMGRFFAESFERRVGRPLAVVTGDTQLAALIALAAPSRPSLYLYATPERSPWVTRQDIEARGAIVVWPATGTRGVPPAAIQERFPGLVPEVPRTFERRFQGRVSLTRIGWAVIRPGGEPAR